MKNWEWIKKGVPLRVELGPRDLESGTGRRQPARWPSCSRESLSPRKPGAQVISPDSPSSLGQAPDLLESIQQNLL